MRRDRFLLQHTTVLGSEVGQSRSRPTVQTMENPKYGSPLRKRKQKKFFSRQLREM